jgi:hypothetical protein
MNESPASSAGTPGAMTDAECRANVRARLAQAEANTDRLRQLGPQEKYLESYFLVEALQSQLDALPPAQRVTRAA